MRVFVVKSFAILAVLFSVVSPGHANSKAVTLTPAQCDAVFYEMMINQLSSVKEEKQLATDEERLWRRGYDKAVKDGQPCPVATEAIINGALKRVTNAPQRAVRGKDLYDRAMAQANYAGNAKAAQLAKFSECELAFYELYASLSGPKEMQRNPVSGETSWGIAFKDFNQAPSKANPCPPMNEAVRNNALRNAKANPDRVFAGINALEYSQQMIRDRAKAEEASAMAVVSRAMASKTIIPGTATHARLVAAMPPCERAYAFLFHRLNHPAYANKRSLTDEEIGWGLDYEQSVANGKACPTMPTQVIQGILAEASLDPVGTLAEQMRAGRQKAENQAIADYDVRARQVAASAEKCWEDKRTEAYRSRNQSASLFYGWQSCAQIVTNAEAMTGVRNIVQPSPQEFNAIISFAISSLRNHWNFQDQSLAKAQNSGDRGPVWYTEREAELQRRNNMIYALSNNDKYIRYISIQDLASKYAPKELRATVPSRPTNLPRFQR